jgi:hypothetical protein
VWRELKKLGAVYLRDGVAVLPRRPEIESRLQGMVDRIAEYEGTADLILSPHFVAEREQQIVRQFQDERESEHREIHHACVRFLRDVLHEVDADDFGFPDVGNLESELGRLHRWYEQIVDRDYFQAPGGDRVSEILAKCDRAFEHFASQASQRADGSEVQDVDDVFDRLGGTAASAQAVPDDYPL